MTSTPALKICKDCGEAKTHKDYNGGKATRCNACTTLLTEKKIAAQTEARRKKKLESDTAKSILRAQKLQARASRKTAVKVRKEKERKEAAAKGYALASAKKFANAERKRLNIIKRELATRTLVKRHLLPFIVRHKSDYIPGWVHKDICAKLEKFAEDVRNKKSPRLMIQMPPRHGKSEIASVNFPAWYLGNNPNHEIITASYSASLAEEFSKKVRSLIRSEEYQSVFEKTRLDPDNQNASGWRTTKSGGFVPAGVGGGITGKGAHVLIIDDPIKNSEEAESEVTQAKIWDWYSSTAYTRLAPGGGVLIIQTRWSDVDLSGRLEHEMSEGTGDAWEIVRYPAVATENETYRRKGDPLHADRYDSEALARIKQAVGPRVWDALYQQNPVAEEGGYFTRDAVKWYVGDAPRRLHVYAAWDLAIGKGDRNDYTVGIVVGVDEADNMYIIDMRRGRWDSFEIVEQIMDVHYEHTPYISGIEKGQIQMAIGPYLEQRIQEERAYDMVVQDLPTGRRDKEARARAIQGRIRQGKVFFPREKPWVDDLMQEMLRFPHGAHDDCVDALAWIGLMLQDMDHPLEIVYGNNKDKNGWRTKILRTLPGMRKHKNMMTS